MASNIVVFFDGVCNLCNSTVDYFIHHDKRKLLHYASLQGDTAAKKLSSAELRVTTIVLLYQDKIVTKSRAVGRMLVLLGGYHALIGHLLLAIPQFIADWAYDFVARHRYHWFGKRDSCRLPNEAERALFLP